MPRMGIFHLISGMKPSKMGIKHRIGWLLKNRILDWAAKASSSFPTEKEKKTVRWYCEEGCRRVISKLVVWPRLPSNSG